MSARTESSEPHAPPPSGRRRRLIRMAAAVGVVLLVAGGGVAAGLYVLGNSRVGRSWLRDAATRQVTAALNGRGRLTMGEVGVHWTGAVWATRVHLLDSAGVAVLSVDSLAGRVRLAPLRDRVIHLARLRLFGVVAALEQEAVGRPWNVAYLLAGDTTRAPAGPPGFGDVLRIDSLDVREASVTTRMPWAPHPVFRGAARDSVIAVRDSLHDLRATGDGRWFEHRALRIRHLGAHDVTLVEPTGRQAGLTLDALVGGISDPAMVVTRATGRVTWTADSMGLQLADVRLPHSQGTASGWLSWDQPGPVRFDVRVTADAGLADLTWVWDVLPHEGRGQAAVHLRTLDDPYDAEYRLERLRVAVGPSALEGQVAVVVRPASLELRDVDLSAARFEDALARRLSYGALPRTVRGTFEGRLRARDGGPLTAFAIDELALRYRDRLGARAALRFSGGLAMGAVAGLRDARLEALRVEMDALRRLVDLPPQLAAAEGLLTGQARITRADRGGVRIASSEVTWDDGHGHRSVVGLAGRVERPLSTRPALEGTLTFTPLDLQAAARLDTTLRVAPIVHGTLRVRGVADSLHWTAALDAGQTSIGRPVEPVRSTLEVSGIARREGARWQLNAAAELARLDLRAWSAMPTVPSTAIDGSARLDLSLPAVGVPSGSAVIDLRQLAGDARPDITLAGRVDADSARVRVDSVRAVVGGLEVAVAGGVARAGGSPDTLTLSARVEQLERMRPELRRAARAYDVVDTAMAARLARLAADSLLGRGTVSGYLTGHLDSLELTASLVARAVQIGGVSVDRVFGSLTAGQLGQHLTVQGTASVDGVAGVGGTALQAATVRLIDATSDRGRFGLEVRGASDLALDVRGRYERPADAMTLEADTVGLRYADVTWRAGEAFVIRQHGGGWTVPPFALRSSRNGVLAVEASIPADGPVSGRLELRQFPLGEFGALLAGTPPVHGTVTGLGTLAGTRVAPRLAWNGTADSLEIGGLRLPQLLTSGGYVDRVGTARVAVRDAAGGSASLEASLPLDLRFATVPRRLLEDRVRGILRADSLRLESLDWTVAGARDLAGTLSGELAVSGTVARPVADGALRLDGGQAHLEALGISPRNASLILRANADSLVLESLRIESGGPRDTLGVRGVLHVHEGEPAEVRVDLGARGFQLARRRDGTDIELGGTLRLAGPLARPLLSGVIRIPRATLAIDPLAARTALDLTSEMARALLGTAEMPVAQSGAAGAATLGRFLQVDSVQVELANDVWVQTPEARVKLSGGLEVASAGDRLTLAGEIRADRGQYRLDLGLVNRSFSVDSGRVRFFAEPTLPTTLDIRATHVVRDAGGTEVPVGVHIGGSYEAPALTLSSTDPLYASAPESEIISLLLFGAPTFALDGQRQSTVQAVTGVLLPSVGGAVEGALQRLLPVFNTVQVTTAGRQGTTDLTAFSLLDNLSISAGKQVGERTFLRLNTGVCRGAGQASIRGASLWYGVAAEHRLAPHLVGQVGVDPGAAPCARLGADVLPRLQFGFDLFREWIW